MKVYTTNDDKIAMDILMLIRLNSDCARVHWSQSIKNIPSNVKNALVTIEEYVEQKIPDLCGKERSVLSEEEETIFLSALKNNNTLKETLGTGVILKGKQAVEVKAIIKSERTLNKIKEAIESGEHVIVF